MNADTFHINNTLQVINQSHRVVECDIIVGQNLILAGSSELSNCLWSSLTKTVIKNCLRFFFTGL